jgi:hypothetical protein
MCACYVWCKRDQVSWRSSHATYKIYWSRSELTCNTEECSFTWCVKTVQDITSRLMPLSITTRCTTICIRSSHATCKIVQCNWPTSELRWTSLKQRRMWLRLLHKDSLRDYNLLYNNCLTETLLPEAHNTTLKTRTFHIVLHLEEFAHMEVNSSGVSINMAAVQIRSSCGPSALWLQKLHVFEWLIKYRGDFRPVLCSDDSQYNWI